MAPLAGDLLCHSMNQALKGHLPPGSSRFFSRQHSGERPQGRLHPPRGTQQCRLVAACSSTGVPTAEPSLTSPRASPRSQSRPRPGIRLQSDPHGPAPSHCAFQGSCGPVRGTQSISRDCPRGSQSFQPQPVTDELWCSPRVSDASSLSGRVSLMGDRTPASVPLAPPAVSGAGLALLSSLLLPPFFTLPGFAWICTFLSGGRGRLPALRWCWVRSSAPAGVFLRHPQGELHSSPPTPRPVLLVSFLTAN